MDTWQPIREQGSLLLWFNASLPLRSGSNLFSRMSLASVPSSIRSSLVITPMVLRPEHTFKMLYLNPSTTWKDYNTMGPQCQWLQLSNVEGIGGVEDVGEGVEDSDLVGRPLWQSSARQSWPGQSWQGKQPIGGSCPWWRIAWACLWSGAQCRPAGPPPRLSSSREDPLESGSTLTTQTHWAEPRPPRQWLSNNSSATVTGKQVVSNQYEPIQTNMIQYKPKWTNTTQNQPIWTNITQ